MAAKAILGTEEILLLGTGNLSRETGTTRKEGHSRIHGMDRQGRLWKRGISAVYHGRADLHQPQTSSGSAVGWLSWTKELASGTWRRGL